MFSDSGCNPANNIDTPVNAGRRSDYPLVEESNSDVVIALDMIAAGIEIGRYSPKQEPIDDYLINVY